MSKHSIYLALLGVLGSETAHAASEAAEGVLGIAFWVFIGYCSIIVVPQVFRAVRYLLSSGDGREEREREGLKGDAS